MAILAITGLKVRAKKIYPVHSTGVNTFAAMVKKVVIIGPESTGKSTLCTQLAAHFGTLWCPEYARAYLLTHGKDYSFAQLLEVARGQLALEETYIRQVLEQAPPQAPPLLFIDTDQYVMKVWCEYVFGDCHSWILQQIALRPYHLYLLCAPDLPWVQDELREYPDEKPRQELYHIYRDLLVQQHVPWALISGSPEERLPSAIEAVQRLL